MFTFYILLRYLSLHLLDHCVAPVKMVKNLPTICQSLRFSQFADSIISIWKCIVFFISKLVLHSVCEYIFKLFSMNRCLTFIDSAFCTMMTIYSEVSFHFYSLVALCDNTPDNSPCIMRIPQLTEHCDVFPIISQAVILRCCSSDWKLLKKNTQGGGFTGFIFSFLASNRV